MHKLEPEEEDKDLDNCSCAVDPTVDVDETQKDIEMIKRLLKQMAKVNKKLHNDGVS